MSTQMLSEGQVIPILFDDKRVNAEVYRINVDKILVRHAQWEWIDKNSPRLFPTDDLVKALDSDSDGDDDLYFTACPPSKEELNRRLNAQRKQAELQKVWKMARKPSDTADDDGDAVWKNEEVTTEEVLSCIKILRKIRSKPWILNEPLFNPIHSYLAQLRDISTSKPHVLANRQTKTERIVDRATKRTADDRLRMRTGIRVARQQRADQSLKFRQILDRQQKEIEFPGSTILSIEPPSKAPNHQNIETKMDVDIADDQNQTESIKETLDEMEDDEVLTLCDAQELDEVLAFISLNVNAPRTTPFRRGTIIRDSDGTQRLDLSKQQLGPQNVLKITESMKGNQRISALLLGGNGIGDDGAKAVADLVMAQRKRIKEGGGGPRRGTVSTIFLGSNRIKKDGIKALTQSLRDNNSVRGLWLKRNPLGIEGAKHISDLLAHNNYLRTLDLERTCIGEEGVRLIADGLISNASRSALQRIYLNGLHLERSCFVENVLTKMMTECTNLKEVFLGTNNLGDGGATELSKALLTAMQIEILSLRSCDIGDDGAIAISWSISSHRNLKYLDFGYAVSTKRVGGRSNRITDRGAMGMAQALSVMNGAESKFERLSLSHNRIGNIGARSLLSAMQKLEKSGNHQMIWLDLDGNVDIEQKHILKAIKRVCSQNVHWKREHIGDHEEDGNGGDVVMDGVNGNIDRNGNENGKGSSVDAVDIGISDKVREQWIVDQGIDCNLGEVRIDDSSNTLHHDGTYGTLTGGARDTLAIRSVYRDSNEMKSDLSTAEEMEQSHGIGVVDVNQSKTENSSNGNQSKSIENPNNGNQSKMEMDDEVTISIEANFGGTNGSKNGENKRSRKRSKKLDEKARRKKDRGDLLNAHRTLKESERVQFETFKGIENALEPAPRLTADQRLQIEDHRNDDQMDDELELNFDRRCYVCKNTYRRQHFFYDSMCRECGDFNFFQRFDSMSCHGMTAIVTGARIKIGYEIALKLLRCGCTVIITTRFPRYAAARYSTESDFKSWSSRLSILGLDFCRLSSVTKFINYIKRNHKRIDMLINNAASTVRRTPSFYSDIIEVERRALPHHIPKALVVEYEHFTDALSVAPPLKSLESGTGPKMIEFHKSTSSSFEDDETGDVMKKVLGSLGQYDENSQPYDMRNNNSWTAKLGQIHPVEMMETIMVNQFVPFLLINELIPLLSNEEELRKSKGYRPNKTGMEYTKKIWNEISARKKVKKSYIINVSAMEGRFHFFKQGTHPHTNMAKAALNMLTRTSGLKLAQQHNVFMVAADTGWVTDELPLKRRIRSKHFEKKTMGGFNVAEDVKADDGDGNEPNKNGDGNGEEKEKGTDFKNDFVLHPPLDEIDGAARCLHPIWSGMRGNPYCGVFLKDYRRIDW